MNTLAFASLVSLLVFLPVSAQNVGNGPRAAEQSRVNNGPVPRAPRLVEPSRGEFRIYDATAYARKPALEACGLRPIHVAYEGSLFAEPNRHKRRADAMPTNELLLEQIKLTKFKKADYMIIDIEAWSVYGSQRYPVEVNQNVARHVKVLQDVKRLAPTIKVGSFSPLPVYAGYERLTADEGSAQYNDMKLDNDNLLPLAQLVDAIFPVGYTMWADRKDWRRAVEGQIREARRLNPNVPLYVFLWPRYADYGVTPTELKSRWIESDYWRFQLETIYDLADGMVLWGGYKEVWDANAPWWVQLRDFMAEKRKQEGLVPLC